MMALLLSLAWASVELPDVLDRVDARVPQLAAAAAEIEAAEAKLLGARGAFDPALVGKSTAYAGKDPRSVLETALEGDTLLGPEWSVGYRRGAGSFPEYAQDDLTSAEGEWVARVEVPLLKGLGFGDERRELQAARTSVDIKQAGRDFKRVELRAKASKAYWKWVAAGAKLSVYENLLEVAQQRRDALETQVERGQRARIDLLDNERVLAERQAHAAQANGEMQRAAVGLSLYFRDDDGQPRVLTRQDLPEFRTLAQEIVPTDDISARPDLRAAEGVVELQSIGVRGARNSLLPKLGASVEQALPVVSGDAETIAGVSVEVPLLFRSGRGKLSEQRAMQTAREQQLRELRDMARAELQGTLALLEAASQSVVASERAFARASEVAALEQRRFELGGVELFTLLMREERVAKAGLELADARLAQGVAWAEWERARGLQ